MRRCPSLRSIYYARNIRTGLWHATYRTRHYALLYGLFDHEEQLNTNVCAESVRYLSYSPQAMAAAVDSRECILFWLAYSFDTLQCCTLLANIMLPFEPPHWMLQTTPKLNLGTIASLRNANAPKRTQG